MERGVDLGAAGEDSAARLLQQDVPVLILMRPVGEGGSSSGGGNGSSSGGGNASSSSGGGSGGVSSNGPSSPRYVVQPQVRYAACGEQCSRKCACSRWQMLGDQLSAVCAGWPAFPLTPGLGMAPALHPCRGSWSGALSSQGRLGAWGAACLRRPRCPGGAWVAPYSGLLKTAQEAQADEGAPRCRTALLALLRPCMQAVAACHTAGGIAQPCCDHM